MGLLLEHRDELREYRVIEPSDGIPFLREALVALAETPSPYEEVDSPRPIVLILQPATSGFLMPHQFVELLLSFGQVHSVTANSFSYPDCLLPSGVARSKDSSHPTGCCKLTG